MSQFTWKHATVIVSFFAAVTVLALTGHDTGALITVGMGVLGALGLVVVQTAATNTTAQATHIQSNGNLSRLMDIVEHQGQMLAQAQPITLKQATPPAPPPVPAAPDPPPTA